jgi:hypothetical protein
MAAPPGEPSLSDEQRRALALLASIPHGVTEGQLALVHRFDRDMIAGLVRAGLATPRRETIETGDRRIKVVRLIITAAGRRALQR